MYVTVLRRFLVILLALSLAGGAAMQFASPALARSAAPTAALIPCDHMVMSTQDDPQDQAMPCNSMPCKGTSADCLQMCFMASAPLATLTPSAVGVGAACHRAVAFWPPDTAHTVLSLKPDPFPPKRSLAA